MKIKITVETSQEVDIELPLATPPCYRRLLFFVKKSDINKSSYLCCHDNVHGHE